MEPFYGDIHQEYEVPRSLIFAWQNDHMLPKPKNLQKTWGNFQKKNSVYKIANLKKTSLKQRQNPLRNRIKKGISRKMQYAKLNMLKSLDSTWLTQVIKVENCDDEEDIKQFKGFRSSVVLNGNENLLSYIFINQLWQKLFDYRVNCSKWIL